MNSSDLSFVLTVFVIFVSIASLICYSVFLSFRYRRRVLQHQERMAALDKGTPLPELIEEQMAPASGRIYLLRGMIWMFSGIAIVGFLSAMVAYSRQPSSMEYQLRRTQELKTLGATDEQIRGAEAEPRDAMPEGVALLGLVPIGIGLAYLIYYRAESQNGAKMP